MTTAHVFRTATRLLGAAAVIAVASTPLAGQAVPGGATSLQETYGDWRVVCVNSDAKKVCALSQQQTDPGTRQLVLAVELSAPAPDRAEGTLILPFGLALERPITLHVDNADGPVLRVRTCLPVGCLVGLTFDPTALARLKKGTVLTVNATADGGQPTSFRISLKGFSEAFDRTAALVK